MAAIKPPKVFVSYSWDNDEHKDWVRTLADRLMSDGVEVILDQWHLRLGDQLPHFMVRSISEADFVLIVCTPSYKTKAEEDVGGVGYEDGVIQGEVLYLKNHRKFVPPLRAGAWIESAPAQLRGKAYLSFADASQFEKKYKELLVSLLGINVGAPVLGSTPDSLRTIGKWKETRIFKGHAHSIKDVAISQDGVIAASSAEGMWKASTRSFMMWRVKDAEGLKEFEVGAKESSNLKALAMDGKAKLILVSAMWCEVFYISRDPVTKRPLLGQSSIDATDHDDGKEYQVASFVQRIAVTNSGGVAVGAGDHIWAWDTKSGKMLFQITVPETAGFWNTGLSSLAIDSSARVAIASRKECVYVFDLLSRERSHIVKIHNDNVKALGLSADGNRAFSCDSRTAKLWDVQNQEVLDRFVSDSGDFLCGVIDSEGNTVALGTDKGKVLIWHCSVDRPTILDCGSSSVNCIAMTPGAEILLAGMQDNSVRVWQCS